MSSHVAMTSRVRRAVPFLSGYYALLLVLLYVPIAVLILFSLNANTVLAFPLQGFSLSWYAKALGTPEALAAARNSVVVATGSSFVATLLATFAAVLITRYQFRGKQLLLSISLL